VTGEFETIERLRRLLPAPGSGVLGIGDDAAAVPSADGWLLLAADAVVEGVHADLALCGLDDLGWKAVAVNVSDVAAMGGRPRHTLVTVAGPPDTDLCLLYRGVADATRAYACPVVGGDLVNAPVVVVTVAITGTVDGEPIRRSGAVPGDSIYATGPLGLAAAGLRQLRRGCTEVTTAVAAHRRPSPSVEAGVAARKAGATSMIDVSDGLVADLGHLASSSGVGVALDRVPVGDGATLDEALTGGEDYVLVFTAPDDRRVSAAFAGLPVERLGTCTADGAERTLGGRPLPEVGGWEHRWA
jgi:thiamine-monophosphate kinase